ncbi:MAG: DMT family transporter [Rhodobacteraceae bacterium]|nr:DMT family transporter [Alphaproteobacteria bacterium]NNK67610.1 DMT family transporter [Paracoccaceae bacterium]
MTETRPLIAAGAILLAMLIIGFIDNFVVLIAEDAGLWQFHLTRSAMALPMIAGLSLLGLGMLRPVRLGAVAARSFLVSIAMVFYFGSLAFLPIAEVAAGLFTAPIFVLLITALIQRQTVGPMRALAVVLGFAGVLMVLRPDAGAFSPWAVVPVLAGLFYAMGAVATRAWCAGESALSLLAGFFLVMAIWGVAGTGLIAMSGHEAEGFILRGWAPASTSFLWWTFVQAVGSIVAVGLIIKGYQLGETSFVSAFEYSLLISVSVWAFVLRGESVDAWAFAGIATIIASGILIAADARNSGAAVQRDVVS